MIFLDKKVSVETIIQLGIYFLILVWQGFLFKILTSAYVFHLAKVVHQIRKMSPKEDDDIDLNEGQLPPDAPTNAEISDFDGSSATIKWKAPENDGGAPIKEYIIEYRKHKTEEWSAKTEIKPTKFPNGKVEELTTNTKYEFRV